MSIQSIGGPPGSAPYGVTGSGTSQSAGTSATPAAPAAPTHGSADAVTKPDMQQLQAAMEEVRNAVVSRNSNLQFSFDDETRKTVVRVVDSESGQVIRQIPSEELIAIAKSIDKMQGLLLKQKA